MFFYLLFLLMRNTYTVTCYEFELRPTTANGKEGYVEMKSNLTWGIMTGHYEPFDDITSRILCKQFGFGLTGFSTSAMDELKLSHRALLWVQIIRCNGSENNASECVKDTWAHSNYWESTLPAGWTRLHCYDYDVTGIRLYGGLVPNVGRLEVKVGGRWGSVFTIPHYEYTPRSLCVLLGYIAEDAIKTSPIELSDNLEPASEVWMTSLRCDFSTTDINNCSFYKGLEAPVAYDVSVRCKPLQLVNGWTPNTGIIEAGLLGKLQMICGTSVFNQGAANVTCNQIGHQSVGLLSAVEPPPDNIGHVFSGSIRCNGTEESLELCDIVHGQSDCNVSTVVYVECLDENQVNLIPIGNKTNEGVFTLTYDSKLWMFQGGSVSNTTAKTLCNFLGHGFEGTSEYVEQLPDHVLPPDYSILHALECSGNETNIAQCVKVPYHHTPCFRCPYSPPVGFSMLYCAECQPGYFGTLCTECNCNNRSTVPCDIHTGECTCQTEWYGTSCEYDIDECVTTTCPNNSDCINVPGSYECICRQGYIRTDDVCEKAPEKLEEKINPLVIILSSVIGGLLLLCIIIITCLCKYRMKGPQPKPNNLPPSGADRPSDEHNLSSINKSTNIIVDQTSNMKPDAGESETIADPYDTLDEFTMTSNDSEMKTEANPEMIGCSHPSDINNGRVNARVLETDKHADYPHNSPLQTDETGYIDLQGYHVNYQGLRQVVGPEHEYDKMKH